MKTSAGKRTLLILAFLVCFDVVSVAAIAVPQNSGQTKPNIVFIVADDLGMQDVGFMGSQYFETPHLDALAEQSLVLNQAYMYPTCSPSRAAILTGKHSFRTGCYNVPVLEKGKIYWAPNRVLIAFFETIVARNDQIETAYVMALLLVRKRLLQWKDNVTRNGVEFMQLRQAATKKDFEIKTASLTPEQIKATQNELAEQLFTDQAEETDDTSSEASSDTSAQGEPS